MNVIEKGDGGVLIVGEYISRYFDPLNIALAMALCMDRTILEIDTDSDDYSRDKVMEFIREVNPSKIICLGSKTAKSLFPDLSKGQGIMSLSKMPVLPCQELGEVMVGFSTTSKLADKNPDMMEEWCSNIGRLINDEGNTDQLVIHQITTEKEMSQVFMYLTSMEDVFIGLDYETNAVDPFTVNHYTTCIGVSYTRASDGYSEGWYFITDFGYKWSTEFTRSISKFLASNQKRIWTYNCTFEIQVSKHYTGKFFNLQDALVLTTMYGDRSSLKMAARQHLGASMWEAGIADTKDKMAEVFGYVTSAKKKSPDTVCEIGYLLEHGNDRMKSLVAELVEDLGEEIVAESFTHYPYEWAAIPKVPLGEYCAADCIYTGQLARKLLPGMENAYGIYIRHPWLSSKFEMNGVPMDDSLATVMTDKLYDQLCTLLHDIIQLCDIDDELKLEATDILHRSLPYDIIDYTPKQRKEKRTRVDTSAGKLNHLKRIFNPGSNTKESRAKFWNNYTTQELKLAATIMLFIENINLSGDSAEYMVKAMDNKYFDSDVSATLTKILELQNDHNTPREVRSDIMTAINVALDTVDDMFGRFASGPVKFQYELHKALFKVNVDDESTWSDKFRMIFNIFLFKKVDKMIGSNINGSTGRAAAWYSRYEEDGTVTRIQPYSDGPPAEYDSLIVNTAFNPLSAATTRWTSGWHCLAGDTMIRLTDGSSVSIEDIYKNPNKDYEVYSVLDGTVEVITDTVKQVHLSGYTDDLVDLEFPCGRVVRCTPNHRFLKTDGEYIEAGCITEDTELVSWSRVSMSGVTSTRVKLEEKIPVYDLSMSQSNPCFSLEVGVISHNTLPASSPARQFIVPRNDRMIFFHCDYSQIELVILAYLSGDPSMIQAFLDGRDMHKFVASRAFEIDYNDVTSGQRRAAKAINFGLIYGKSIENLAVDATDGDVERAREIFDFFFRAFPGIKTWMDEKKDEVDKYGYVTTMFGNRIPIDVTTGGNRRYRQAVNAPIQGTASTVAGACMYDFTEAVENAGIISYPVGFTHDAMEDMFDVDFLFQYIDLMHYHLQDKVYEQAGIPVKIDFEVSADSGGLVEVDIKHRDDRGAVLELSGVEESISNLLDRLNKSNTYRITSAETIERKEKPGSWVEMFTVGTALQSDWGVDTVITKAKVEVVFN